MTQLHIYYLRKTPPHGVNGNSSCQYYCCCDSADWNLILIGNGDQVQSRNGSLGTSPRPILQRMGGHIGGQLAPHSRKLIAHLHLPLFENSITFRKLTKLGCADVGGVTEDGAAAAL